jgi:hypothetical protein
VYCLNVIKICAEYYKSAFQRKICNKVPANVYFLKNIDAGIFILSCGILLDACEFFPQIVQVLSQRKD